MSEPIAPTFQQAQQLLAKGKALLVASKFEDAVQSIGEALELATKVKGELDYDLAEFYYGNGNALLCRYEESVQDQLLQADPLQDTAGEFQDEGTEPIPAQKTEVPEMPLEEIKEESKAEAEDGVPEEKKEDDNESDLDELQLAWENLETARIIYVNGPSGMELVKVHVRLGDLEVIRESYQSAYEEYTKALMLLDATEPSRKLAEIYYLLGTTSLAVPEHETEALKHFDLAIATLKVITSEPQDVIEELIKEINEKREDAVEQAQSYAVLKESFKSIAGDAFSPPQNPGGPVIDLGVAKRKREDKPDEKSEKKPKLDNP